MARTQAGGTLPVRSVRTWSGVIGVAVLLAVASCGGSESFHGTVLVSDGPAPPFELRDQFGADVGLSDAAGKVVVLTFLYTYCPDVCPVVTETLRRAHELLGDDATEIEMVAISLDPERDSVERVYEYSLESDMLGRWRFLVGSEDELKPVWKAYWLDPVRDVPSAAGTAEAEDHHSPTDDYLITHTAPVFLIDRSGHRRVLFTNLTLDPQPLVHDIRLLIKEKAT